MKKTLFPVVLFLSMALVMLFGSVSAEAACAPKVDNFILFVDQSGSMYMHYQKSNILKMAVAKQILLDMNALIPELGYKGGVDLFAPFAELQAPVVYNRAALGAALQNHQRQSGNLRPSDSHGPGDPQRRTGGGAGRVEGKDGRHHVERRQVQPWRRSGLGSERGGRSNIHRLSSMLFPLPSPV